MDSDTVMDFLFRDLGQTIISQSHIRKQSVAAHGRNLVGAQYRTQRRFHPPGDVGVPKVFSPARLRTMLDAKHFGVGLALRRCRVNFQLTKAACKADVLFTRYILIAKKNDFVSQ